MTQNGPLIVVAGPTASGKSDLAIQLARELNGEIISCDSVQVYRGFDIGSAKATSAERAAVPHHLIDCCEPGEQYHAARFREDALKIIEDMRMRGVQPVLAGGTTLYLSALLSGLSSFPEGDSQLRSTLQGLSVGQRYQLLTERDPERAAKLHPNDTVRVVRALEITLQTGVPASQQTAVASDVPALVINLCVENGLLAERISRRTAAMIEAGLLSEVRELLRESPRSAAPFSTVGYAEALQHLNGEIDAFQMAESITIATRRLAKRQRTFWRNEPQKRGWKVLPEAGETPVVVSEDLAAGSRGRVVQRGFRAYDFSRRVLIQRITERLAHFSGGVEVWHVALRAEQINQ